MKNVEDIYPLSPTQEGMLFQTLYAAESDVYFRQMICGLHGPLDVPAFEQAWQQVLKRHPALRTGVLWEGLEKPLQVVRRQIELPWQQIDWRGLPEEEQEKRLEAFLKTDQQLGFELSRAPLMRVTLARIADDAHQLIWSHHHLLLDGWSKSLLLKEVLLYYQSLSRCKRMELPPAPPFRNYIAWLRQQNLDHAEAFWRETLRGLKAPTSLGLEPNGNSAPRSFSDDAHETQLSVEATAAFQALARRSRLTMNTLVQGAWAVLLSRYSGEEDVVMGNAVAGRPPGLPGAESMIGLFISALPIRVHVSPEEKLLPWLARLQDQQAQARQYEFSALSQIQRWSEVPNGLPLFESIVVFENTPIDQSFLLGSHANLEVRNFRMVESTDFPLTVEAMLSGPQLTLRILCAGHSFEARAVNRMLGHLKVLLEEMSRNPDQRLSELSLLTDSEEHQLLFEWNDTFREYSQKLCLHELFEAQVAETPEAIAITYGAGSITYRSLNERANQLAYHLRSLGVGPEVRVGICLEPSIEMVVGLLGILKAGGAYVPLDPQYPEQRLAFMIADSELPVLLTQQHLADQLPQHNARVVNIDVDWDYIALRGSVNPPSNVDAENIAYVIYTSGSTGRPKGVQISHHAVANLLQSMRESPGLTNHDVLLAVTTLSFDIAALEIFLPLITGARLVVVSRETASDGAQLLETLTQSGATVMQATPATWRMLQESGWQGSPQLNIFCGGEALPPELANQLCARGAGLWNLYGPTETTIWSTRYQIESPGDLVPIGRPIANTHTYLLDSHLGLVPAGVTGELYIGGDGLARGYLGRPELTAEKFIPDPFDERGGARLYRTGDLARYRPTGDIEYLGRMDHQVKLRGYRVETGEIETTLAQHEAVRQAVVTAHQNGDGEKRLVAYVVGDRIVTAELQQYLRSKLPSYMIPGAYVVLDQMPLTPNGKIDRRALPAPEHSQQGYVGPTRPAEEILAGIWSQVLRVEQVGTEDNFFELGGHSLLATQVISRVRASFGIEINLRMLFEHPTIRSLAEVIDEKLRGGAGTDAPAIQKVSRTGELVLSFAQRRLWFLDQFEPDSGVYNMSAAVRLRGNLDFTALERSLVEVINRHESLRTRFGVVNGGPVQLIDDVPPISIPITDLSTLPEAERDAETRRIATEESQRPFDLSCWPLLRVRALRLGEEEYVLLCAMHHIICDGWSIGVFIRELAGLYEAYAQGQESSLPELPIQYADYAQWQQEWLQEEVLDQQLSYWKEQLAGAATVLELPTDRPRPTRQTFRGAQQRVRISPELSEALKVFSRAEGVTLFMTLLGALQTLLFRYSGQEQITIGSPIANRNRRELESLIGFFANTLALRTDLSGDPSFRELLGRVREVALGGYAHQDVPFEKLVEELQPERSMSHSPLFQVMLVLQNAPGTRLQLPGVSLETMEVESGTAKFDLLLSLAEEEQGLAGWLEYNTDLFDAATIERMLSHFEVLLESVVSNPEQQLSELPLLTAAEREQILVEWNSTAAECEQQCIHELFAVQVERTPEAIAVVYGEEQVSYQELNERADRLAHYLQSLGVGPESLVGICVERSAEMVVGLLGILKAGGAYVPLDPVYPQERLSFMMADAGVRVLLTQQRLAGLFSSEPHRLVMLDSDWDTLDERPISSANKATVQNLAYVLYTSGSTGRPKGVAMTHEALVNLIVWQLGRPGFTRGARTLQFASLNFDASFHEMFETFCSGGQLVLISEEARRDPEQLLQTMAANSVERLHLPFIALKQLAEAAEKLEVDLELSEVLTAGEQLRITPEIQAWFERLGTCLLENQYGPSEAHVVTVYRMADEIAGWPTLPPIGGPIANTEIYLLDAHLEPVAVGLSGQLYIGGVALARGYLNRPELTAERFIPNPFGDRPGGRLYATGDLARYQANGAIEYLGRMDHQVKVRGYRIELGEVEAALCRHESVREAVVVALADEGGGKRLVAYVVSEDEPPAGRQVELRQHLHELLPEYMVPSAFVWLDRVPLTPSGKIDRRALPAPESSAASAHVFVPPRTTIEEVIAGIWMEVLKVGQVSIHDHFFEIGGHSLLATQVISRLRAIFQIEIPVRRLFEHPRLAELAATVETSLRTSEGMLAPPIVRVTREQELPLSFAQQRLWFLAQLEPDNPSYNIAGVVRLKGVLEVAALEASFNEIIRRHEVLRTRFASVGGRVQQFVTAAAPLSLSVTDLSGREQELEQLASAEAREPFDLGHGPLLRVRLLRLAEEEHALLLTIHHIASDGWSMGVLLREFKVLYEAYARGEESPLAELEIQYADFAHWQREWLQGEVLERQLNYWKQQLDGAPALLELPTDYPRPAVQTFHGAREAITINGDLVAKLKQLSRENGATLFMTLLAAFKTLLWRYSLQDDIVVGTPIANRTTSELEGLIGFFVNTLVLRTSLKGAPSFTELIGRVREAALGAYTHQDVPFEKLVEELQVERSLSHNSLFQVWFVLQNAPMEEIQLPGLALDQVEFAKGWVRHDLRLDLLESSEGLTGSFEYRTDLFDPNTIKQMAGNFETLLGHIASEPATKIDKLAELLVEADLQQQLIREQEFVSASYQRLQSIKLRALNRAQLK